MGRFKTNHHKWKWIHRTASMDAKFEFGLVIASLLGDSRIYCTYVNAHESMLVFSVNFTSAKSNTSQAPCTKSTVFPRALWPSAKHFPRDS